MPPVRLRERRSQVIASMVRARLVSHQRSAPPDAACSLPTVERLNRGGASDWIQTVGGGPRFARTSQTSPPRQVTPEMADAFTSLAATASAVRFRQRATPMWRYSSRRSRSTRNALASPARPTGQTRPSARSNRRQEDGALFCSGVVRSRRLELPRPFGHSHLKAARLPIPPRPHADARPSKLPEEGRQAGRRVPLARGRGGRKRLGRRAPISGRHRPRS